LAKEAELSADLLITAETPDEKVETRRVVSKFRDLERNISRYVAALENGDWSTAWRLLKDGIPPILLGTIETARDYCEA